MDQPRRRLSAVWFADIVGYTELSSVDEPAALALVTELQALARDIVEREFEGRVVKFIGDAILAEFGSTDSAVRSAITLQERYVAAARARGQDSQLHVGVHLGEVTATPDGDLYGDGINTAARLQHEAGAGQVIISEDVWRQLRQRPEFRFAALGAVELKGITSQVEIFDVLFGARAALAPSGAVGLAESPSGPSLGRPKRSAAIALVAVGLIATVAVPRLLRKTEPERTPPAAGAASRAVEPPALETPATETPQIGTPSASTRPTGTRPTTAVRSGRDAPPPTPGDSRPASEATRSDAPTPADLAAVRVLLERFVRLLASEDPVAAIRRLYPEMPMRQAIPLRGIRQQLGPNVETRIGSVEPLGTSGDTIALRFTVQASSERGQTAIPFEGRVIRTPAGPRIAQLTRSEPLRPRR